MYSWTGWPLLQLMAEDRRAEDLRRFERLSKLGLTPDEMSGPGPRATIAGWLMRLALRLDRRSGEALTQFTTLRHA